ncbi:hypothetical protein VNI00_018787 [Paramarasmius palmivorus]|uniref:Uncharacterized protein n=1 Tax=Paramarasmius palmivorus TaxID=297713 RepID=A0AAW0AW99_9AGAR
MREKQNLSSKFRGGTESKLRRAREAGASDTSTVTRVSYVPGTESRATAVNTPHQPSWSPCFAYRPKTTTQEHLDDALALRSTKPGDGLECWDLVVWVVSPITQDRGKHELEECKERVCPEQPTTLHTVLRPSSIGPVRKDEAEILPQIARRK